MTFISKLCCISPTTESSVQLQVDGRRHRPGHNAAAHWRQTQHLHLYQSSGWVCGAAGAGQAEHWHHQTLHSGSQLAGAFPCESRDQPLSSDWWCQNVCWCVFFMGNFSLPPFFVVVQLISGNKILIGVMLHGAVLLRESSSKAILNIWNQFLKSFVSLTIWSGSHKKGISPQDEWKSLSSFSGIHQNISVTISSIFIILC